MELPARSSRILRVSLQMPGYSLDITTAQTAFSSMKGARRRFGLVTFRESPSAILLFGLAVTLDSGSWLRYPGLQWTIRRPTSPNTSISMELGPQTFW